MAGVISGMNRGPKFPPRARRAGAKLALTDPDQIQITGNLQLQIVVSDYTDTTDLPASPVNGQMVLLVEGAEVSYRLCIFHEGEWYEEVLTQMS